jgi:hypothetical protein
MNLSSTERSLIESYLEAVGGRLAEVDRDETLAGIESHIHEAIAARVETGERAGVVAAVLAEMDPPEFYGTDSPALDEGSLAVLLRRMIRSNWMWIVGSALCALGVFFALFFPWHDNGASILMFSLLPLGFVLLVIGWLKRAYADGGSVIIRPLHQAGIVGGLFLLWIGVSAILLPVMALGAVMLILGCLPWAFKLPWYVTLPLGAVLVGIACSADAYVPVLFVPAPPAGPDDAAGALKGIHAFSIGLLGVVLTLSGLTRVVVNLTQGANKALKDTNT